MPLRNINFKGLIHSLRFADSPSPEALHSHKPPVVFRKSA